MEIIIDGSIPISKHRRYSEAALRVFGKHRKNKPLLTVIGVLDYNDPTSPWVTVAWKPGDRALTIGPHK